MYFEDFEPGRTMVTSSRAASEQDLDDFVRLSGLDNPLFTDRNQAVLLGHKDRLVPAPLQLSLVMGLAQKAGWFDHVVAVAEFKELKFLRPVYPGDEIGLTARVVSKRSTSKPDRGLVVLAYEVKNSRGDLIMSSTANYLFKKKS